MSFLSPARALRPLKKLSIRGGCLKGLDFLWLEITRRCNLACTHCYANSDSSLPLTEKMQFDDWCSVIRDARMMGCRRLQFVGGEPTLHPDLDRLLHYARGVGFKRCEVFTNATLVRESLVRTFRELRTQIHFSFYSYDPDVHDRVTSQERSFERTVYGIRQLVQSRIPLAASVIIFEENAENAAHLKKTKRFLRELGVNTIGTDRVRGVGRGAQLVSGAAAERELCGECWSGKLCIDANGDAHPCVFSRFATVGNVLEEDLQTVVAGTRLRAFRLGMFLGHEEGRDGVQAGGSLQDC
jgi:MoaA/NifB/PqqE/SkfB family radical SAM enzyme